MTPGAFDVVTLAVGAVGYMLGRSRGLVWQASGLVTLVGGGLCATVLSRPLGRLFADGVAGRFVAWLAVYAVVAVCLYVLTLKFKHRIQELEFDELDRRFGGMFGTVKALVVFALITIVAAGLAPRLAAPVKASLSGQALRALVHEARLALPEKIHDAFGPWLDVVDEPPPVEPAPHRWPEADPRGAPAAPSPRPSTPAATPSAPAPPDAAGAAPTPAPSPASSPAERPAAPRRAPPRVDPVLDPFDPSTGPADPLAPPRR
ncbi:MAG: CvpA family protein [Planctomycetes bacterium]|nr:CvpA family protein [Planctomycetota bacterium]